jgi:HTH-type transcriptional regulator/antitoxin HigA
VATISPIRTKEDYEAALARISEILHAEIGTPEGDELDILVDLVELYEERHHSIALPSAIAAIEYYMDQHGLTQRDLMPYLGSRSKVSEVLSGKRDITMSMARALQHHLGISAAVLLRDPGAGLDPTFDNIDSLRFPLKQMAKAGWIDDVGDLLDRSEELIGDLIERAGGRDVAAAVLYRKNDQRRINAKTDEYALRAWCWQAMALAQEDPPDAPYQQGSVTENFLRKVAQLSTSEDGPRRAQDFLAQHGIGLRAVPHLRRTHLDGAALKLAGGRPVIGLTLRYDRIDNFWFTLLHELAHVGLHLDGGNGDTAFVDDHSLRGKEPGREDSTERDADRWAEDALIPPSMWENSAAQSNPTAMAVVDLAWQSGVHPAIVAGRVRHEQRNYRLLSQFVGTGEVRRQFHPVMSAAG